MKNSLTRVDFSSLGISGSKFVSIKTANSENTVTNTNTPYTIKNNKAHEYNIRGMLYRQ